ncbi:MAG: transglycosylase SLT domain-containing protein [Gammaproteobacteria bacterium]|jgi:soluble lytic murein transglycosylase|nr:transglycosylase SLT domain-containing protein [Gammaproteobacteria bacterium]
MRNRTLSRQQRRDTGWNAAIPLLISLLAAMPAAGGSPAQQREDFVAAESALRRGDSSTYVELKLRLQDYPLYPYLEYEEIRGSNGGASAARVEAFLGQYADTPLAASVRAGWLEQLARAGRWGAFLEAYQYERPESLRCHYANALIQTGQRDAGFARVEELWLTGDSLPDSCTAPVGSWKAAGRLTPTLFWQRVGLVMAEGDEGLARALVKSMPKSDQAWVDRWLKVRKSPKTALHQAEAGGAHPARDFMIADAVRQLARADEEAALDLWESARQRWSFAPEARAAAEQRLAVSLLRDDSPAVAAFYQRLAPRAGDLTMQEARVRWALAQAHWTLALQWIDALPTADRGGERWQYWKARALEALGRRDEARDLYETLARQRSYYGFLAADRAGQSYAIEHRPATVDGSTNRRVRELPTVQRAGELLALDRVNEARREWRWLLDRAVPEELKAAARIAQEWGWHDQAAFTLARAAHWDDYEIRFPVLHLDTIRENANAQALDPAWVLAVVRQESVFNPTVRSSAGATGLMQLMPATASHVARKYFGETAPDRAALTDPESNVRLGTTYLRSVLDDLYGNPVLATAAYNAGPGRVRQWMPSHRNIDADVWVELVPFRETQDYLRKVLSYAVFYEHRLGRTPAPMSERMPPVGRSASMARGVTEDSGPSG